MDEKAQVEAHEKALKDDLKAYTKLDKINDSDEFNTFFDFQVDTAVKKMLALFTGTGPKDWEEFCRIRGEVIALLYPIQQIRGAKVLKEQAKKQLSDYYNTQV